MVVFRGGHVKYSAYDDYRPSPISWLDQMPAHWHSAALRWMSRRYSGGTPDKGNEGYWDDGEIPWLNSGAVNDGYITEPSALITREGFVNSSAKWIPSGALVMALAGQGKTKGMVAQLGIPATCNQSMAAIIPDNRLDSRYLIWWLTANYQNIRNLAGGDARDGLNLDMLGSIPCPLPPVDEQKTIVRFLDAKTAQIDVLVAQKRQLIDKLKEKRSALIARVITSGLPPEVARAAGLEPNPKMKDSGAAWLGCVPASWKAKAIKWESPVRRGASPRPIDDPIYFDDEGEYAWVRISDVTAAGMYLEYTEQRLSELGSSLSVKLHPGSLFISIAGTVGKPCIANIRCCIHDGFVCFPRWKGDSRFLFYIFASGEPYKGLGKLGTQLNLNTDTVGSIVIGVPCQREQEMIAGYLDVATAEIDAMMATVGVAIDRLVEYRQALITSAVTGKIDVRGPA